MRPTGFLQQTRWLAFLAVLITLPILAFFMGHAFALLALCGASLAGVYLLWQDEQLIQQLRQAGPPAGTEREPPARPAEADRAAAAAAEDAARRARSLADGDPSPLVLVDARGSMLEWNAAAGRAFGFVDQLRGQPLADTIGLADLDGWLYSPPAEPVTQDGVELRTAAGPALFSVTLAPAAEAGRYVVALADRTAAGRGAVEQVQGELDAARAELDGARAGLTQIQGELARSRAEARQLRASLDQQARTAADLEERAAGLEQELSQARDHLRQLLVFKGDVLNELAQSPNAVVIVREGNLLWMNTNAEDLLGVFAHGCSEHPLDTLLPGLDEHTLRRLTLCDGWSPRMAAEAHECLATRPDGIRLRVLVDAVPTDLMVTDLHVPGGSDLLLILRDATPAGQRHHPNAFVRMPWWQEPEQPAPAPAEDRYPAYEEPAADLHPAYREPEPAYDRRPVHSANGERESHAEADPGYPADGAAWEEPPPEPTPAYGEPQSWEEPQGWQDPAPEPAGGEDAAYANAGAAQPGAADAEAAEADSRWDMDLSVPPAAEPDFPAPAEPEPQWLEPVSEMPEELELPDGFSGGDPPLDLPPEDNP